jgi:hypothetical protein
MRTLSAGPNGVFKPGDERTVSEAEAKMLVTAGSAEIIEGKPDKKTDKRTPQTADQKLPASPEKR